MHKRTMKFSSSASDLCSLSSTYTKDGATTKRSSETMDGIVKNRRMQLARNASLRLDLNKNSNHEANKQRYGSSMRDLGCGNDSINEGSEHGLVANRRRQITKRLSMDHTCGNKQTANANNYPKRLSTCKSFPQANHDSASELDENDLQSGSGHSRIAAMRERFNNSNASLGSGFDSFSTLDTNNSRHSTLKANNGNGSGSFHSIPELFDSDNDDDSDDDSIGSFGEEEHEDESSFHLSSVSKMSLSGFSVTSGTGEVEAHEAGMKKLLEMENSFNTTFLSVGGSGKDCRQTGKGSVFVMADSKLANTKIVRNKLDRAARTIQRFFRYSHAILDRIRDEVDYWQEEKEDIERRRVEELEDIQRHLEVQKQQFAMQLEHETIQKLQDELNSKRRLVDQLEEEVQVEKEENEKLKESLRTLTHENKKLAAIADDPVQADKVKDLSKQILSLQAKKNQREDMLAQCKEVASLYRCKIQREEKKIVPVQAQKQRMKECIKKVLKLLEANLDKFAIQEVFGVMESKLATVDPKLAKRINKRRKKIANKEAADVECSAEGPEASANGDSKLNAKVSQSAQETKAIFPENRGRSKALVSSDSQHSNTAEKKGKKKVRSSSLKSALEASRHAEAKESSLKTALSTSKHSESKSKKKKSCSSRRSSGSKLSDSDDSNHGENKKNKKKSSRRSKSGGAVEAMENSGAFFCLITGKGGEDDTVTKKNELGPSASSGALMSLITGDVVQEKKSKRKSSRRSSMY